MTAVGSTATCTQCSAPFVVTKIGQRFCSRACSNKGRDSRRSPQLNRPCDCGSGLPARRTTVPDSRGFRVGCDACKVTITAVVRRETLSNDYDKAQARARRRIEEMREEREARA